MVTLYGRGLPAILHLVTPVCSDYSQASEFIFVQIHSHHFLVVKLCILPQGQNIREILDISCFVGIYINQAY